MTRLGLLFLFAALLATPSVAQIRLLEIDATDDLLTLKNFGGSTVDVSDYHVCSVDVCANPSGLAVVSGSLSLAAGASVTLTYAEAKSAVDNALFLPTAEQVGGTLDLTNADNMVDYMRYAAGATNFESVAVTKTIWVADEIAGTTFQLRVFTGGATDHGSLQWVDGLPEADVNPSSLSFTQVASVGASAGQTVTMANIGYSDLTLTADVTITGADAADFSITAGNVTGGPIARSTNRVYTIVFDPSTTGSKTAALSFATDDADETSIDITLSGTSIEPEIDSDPASLDFGGQLLSAGATAAQSVTINNTGVGDLTISSLITITGTDADQFTISTGDTSAGTLAEATTRVFEITFDPSSLGAKSASLTIESNDADEGTFTVPLSGVGETPPVPRLLYVDSPNDELTIKNFGGSTLDISNYFVCTNTSCSTNLTQFTIESGSLSLAAGASVVLSNISIIDGGDSVSLFIEGGDTSTPGDLVDYMQFTAFGSAAEAVAVAKGIWTAGEFVTGTPPWEYNGDGTQNGNSFWSDTDSVFPTVLESTIYSSNADPTVANVGDTVTFNLTTDEDCTINSATFFDSEETPTVAGGPREFSLTYVVQGTETVDHDPVAFNVVIADQDINLTPATTTTDGSSVTLAIDVTGPTFSTLTIASDNADPTTAEQFDRITISFTTPEPVNNVKVTMFSGNLQAAVSGGPTSWTAVREFGGDEELADGPITFSVSADDVYGNTATSTTTTDGSSVALVVGTNPLLCEYDGSTTPPQRFYRNSTAVACETTPTQANSCHYDVNITATEDPSILRIVGADDLNPLFPAPVTRLDNYGTQDRLYMAFNLPSKYYKHKQVFADADETNGCGPWTVTTSTDYPGAVDYPVYNSDDYGNCYVTYEYSAAWTDVFNLTHPRCGWVKTETASTITLTLDYGVYAWEDLNEFRGVPLRRNFTFSHPIQIEFPKDVDVTSSNIVVFAPVNVLAALTSQAVEYDIATGNVDLTVNLITEVQKPFELHAITENTTPASATLLTTMDGSQGSDDAVRQDAECTDPEANCANNWRFSYRSSDTTPPCTFDGTYSVDFRIRCANEALNTGDCAVDGDTDEVTIQFIVESSDHCTKVTDVVELTSTLVSYDREARTTPEDDFLDEQVAYFHAPTSAAEVSIAETEFQLITIERPNSAESNTVLLDQTNGPTHTAAAVGVGPTLAGPYDFGHNVGGPVDAGVDSVPTFQFTVKTDASHLNLPVDGNEEMVISAIIDVRYNNPVAKRRRLKFRAHPQDVRSKSVEASSSLSATGTHTPATQATGSSSGTILGMSANVAFLATGGIVLVMIAAIVVLLRRDNTSSKDGDALPMEKLNSEANLDTTITSQV